MFEAEKHSISTSVQPISGFEFEDQLDQLTELCDEGLVDITKEEIILTAKGKRLSTRKVTRAKFGIPF